MRALQLAVRLCSIVLLCGLLPTAQSQSSYEALGVRVLTGPSFTLSGETAFHGQARVHVPLGIRPSIEPYILWRARRTVRYSICPIAGPCPVEREFDNDVFGVGVTATVDLVKAASPGPGALYVGGSVARHWLLHDDKGSVSAFGILVGGQLKVSRVVAFGGEIQLGFSHEERSGNQRGISIAPVFQLVVGR